MSCNRSNLRKVSAAARPKGPHQSFKIVLGIELMVIQVFEVFDTSDPIPRQARPVLSESQFLGERSYLRHEVPELSGGP